MQSSRRAFLFGRQRPPTAWDAFLQRLTRVVQGQVRVAGKQTRAAVEQARAVREQTRAAREQTPGGREETRVAREQERAAHELLPTGAAPAPNRARLVAAHREDVRQARALCAEYGIVLQLHGMALTSRTGGEAPRAIDAASLGDVLEVDPSHLDAVTHDPQRGQWLAQPGCRVGALAAAGLSQFRDAPADITLAAWLAQPADWPTGATALSGVVAVDVLLADGTTERLGPFGAADVQPLRSATVQRLVPALFQLSSSPDAIVCREAAQWPCRYRLDALQPRAPAQVNLAHLLLGAGGTLAWVEAIALIPVAAEEPASSVYPSRRDTSQSNTPGSDTCQSDTPQSDPPQSDTSQRDTPQNGIPQSDIQQSAARRLQIRIKNAFDPMDLYGQ